MSGGEDKTVRREGGGSPGPRGGSGGEAGGSETRAGQRPDGAESSPKANAPAEILDHLKSQPGTDSRYTLRNEVARGGMGAILKVWDENLRRDLAMKVVLKPGGGSEPASVDDVDPKQLKRFLEEAQVTGQLDHPGVVPVHALGVNVNGALYFTMRLVRGRDLQKIFKLVHEEEEEGWTTTRALGVMLKVCEAMAYAHSKAIIHRDLKPANIMVGRFGEVYVMDWGLARVLGEEDMHDLRIDVPDPKIQSHSDLDVREKFAELDASLKTMDGDIVGTPSYMPLEQARGRVAEIGPAADIYAVGAMLYHLLGGRVPYMMEDEKPSPLAVLTRVLEGPPPPLVEVNADVPGELEAICEKAMQRAPEDRYPTMEALANDLRAFLEGRVVQAYETGAVAEIRKWIARNRALAAASAAALVALVVGLAVSSVLYVRADHNAKLAETRRQEAEKNEELAVANEKEAVDARRQADASAREALESAELARERQAEAEAERIKVLRLSDVKRLDGLEAEAAALWPAVPERVSAYNEWLTRASALAERLPLHREALKELRERAFPLGPGEREALPILATLEGARAATPRDEELIRSLEAQLAEQRPWTLPSAEEQWQHDVLAELVARLEAFAGEAGRLQDVSARLAFAETVGEQTVDSAEARAAWNEAIASIRDRDDCPMYGGLELAPQLGLLPIGRDPASGLWEFVHVQTGSVPERRPDGTLVLAEGNGIVFVLLPGGRASVGAQAETPGQPYYDPSSVAREGKAGEGPVASVDLDPFFFAKFEMTQGQWLRFTGANPSTYEPEREFGGHIHDELHPVEQVSWEDAAEVFGNLGLRLPTEAQWEYAARGGTTTVWWTGDERDSLVGAANLADRTAAEAGANWSAINEWPELNDAFAVHAPVGSYRANPFGLYDVHGNVYEWCQDWVAGTYDTPPRPGDGLREIEGARYRSYRGGSFIYSASDARVAARTGNAPDYRASSVGCRAVRVIE